MTWQILVTMSIISNSFAGILQRVLARHDESDPVAYSIIFQLIVAVLFGLILLVHGFHMIFTIPVIVALGIMAASYALANVLNFQSLKSIEVSEFIVISSSWIIWSILGSVVVLQEKFSLLQVLGTALILVSVAIVSWRGYKVAIRKGEILALLGAVMSACAFTSSAYALRSLDALSFSFLAWALPALAIWAAFPKATQKIPLFFKRELGPALLALCTCSFFTSLGLYYAYQLGRNAAQISAIFQTTAILTVILAVVLLRETSRLWLKLAAVVICVAGVMLVG